MGTNVYRGPSMRDLYQRTQDTLKKPVLFSEFGADAYNAKNDQEDHLMQADMLLAQWEEIYRQSYGHGGVGNALGGSNGVTGGGSTFNTNLDVHDTNASWPNGGYPDFVEGENNMNEEWFGITAATRRRGPTWWCSVTRFRRAAARQNAMGRRGIRPYGIVLPGCPCAPRRSSVDA